MKLQTIALICVLSRIIEDLRALGFAHVSSTDIIRELNGTYLVDEGIPDGASPNACLGRFISRHAAALGIVQIATKQPAWDDRDPPRKTCCARYALNPVGSDTAHDRRGAPERASAIH